MTDPVCVDANIIIALVREEHATPRVEALWETWRTEGRRLVAPQVLRFEVAGVFERKARSGELESDLARMALEEVEGLMATIELLEITGGLTVACDLAVAHNLRIFDSCYVAIAQQEGAELWTLDETLAKRANGKVP